MSVCQKTDESGLQACADSKDPDQPAPMRRLIRVFAVRQTQINKRCSSCNTKIIYNCITAVGRSEGRSRRCWSENSVHVYTNRKCTYTIHNKFIIRLAPDFCIFHMHDFPRGNSTQLRISYTSHSTKVEESPSQPYINALL